MIRAKGHDLLVLLALLAPGLVSGQESLLRRANKLYEQYSFAEAITTYEEAFELGAHDHEAARRLADSYRRVRRLPESEQWYALVVSGPGATPTDLLNYADALRANGRYATADSVIAVFASRSTSDSRVERLAHTSELSARLIMDPFLEGRSKLLPYNSEEMDLGPTLLGDQVVFASARTPQISVRRMHAWDGKPFLNLFIANDSTVSLLKGSVNTHYHESNACFSPDGTEMYFTRNSYMGGESTTGEDGFNNLMIYSCRLVDGEWKKESEFPFNMPSYSTAHPALSADGRTLYFSSNRPWGFGGADIWKSSKAPDGDWQEPVNLGPAVNTEGDELFPTLHGNDALFFASDGHAGLGGLDLFLSWVLDNGAQAPINLGAPMNSRSDDMSLVLAADGASGYLCSDRPGGRGGADLYGVVLDKPFEHKMHVGGRITSKEDGTPFPNIPVRMVRPDRSIIAQQLTDRNGVFDFAIMPQPFTVIGGIPGASEEEIPMDEFILVPGGGDLYATDIQFSGIVNVPLALRVVDTGTGLPAPGVDATLVDGSTSGTVVLQGTTDDHGLIHGSLKGVPVGREYGLKLTLGAPGRAAVEEQIPFRVQDASERLIERPYSLGNDMISLARAQNRRLFRFIEEREDPEGRKWSGRVVDSKDGKPVAQVPVSLLDIHRSTLATTVTDMDGHYSLFATGVPSTILASIPGGQQIEMNDVPAFGDSSLLDMRINSVMDLPVNALLHDEVTNEPLPGVLVTLTDARDGQVIFQRTTDAHGLIQGQIPDRRFGSELDIKVTFEKEGFLRDSIMVDFSVLTFLEQSLTGQLGMRMSPAVPAGSPDPSADPAAEVWSGRVVDLKDGKPVAQVPVSLLDEHRTTLASTVTDKTGHYRLSSTGSPSTILASIPGGQQIELNGLPTSGDSALSDIRINSVMDLPVNALLHDEMTNEPLSGVVVTLTDARDGQVIFQRTTNEHGLIQGQIPDRRFGTELDIKVTFEKEGFLRDSIMVDFSVLTFLEQSLTGRSALRMSPLSPAAMRNSTLDRTTPGAVPKGARSAQASITDPDAGAWSGRVVDLKDGTPVAHVPVSLLDIHRTTLDSTVTDIRGRYRLASPAVPSTILASIPGGQQIELNGLGVSGDSALADIRINSVMDLPVNALIRDEVTNAPLSGVVVTLTDARDGQVIFRRTTNEHGLIQGQIPDRRFGTELDIKVTFEKEGFLRDSIMVDFSVLTFLEQTLTGPNGSHLRPVLNASAQRTSAPNAGGKTPLQGSPAEGSGKHTNINPPTIPDPDAEVWSGLVVDSRDGRPVAHVPVSLLGMDQKPLATATTDMDGRYRLFSAGVPGSIVATIPGGERIELTDVLPFGEFDLADIRINSVLDLPVNALLRDGLTNEALQGVLVTLTDARDGRIIFQGTTNEHGLVQGQIPDRRFGTELGIKVTFEKEGFLPASILVDFSLLTFLEQTLTGPNGLRLSPAAPGMDLAASLDLRPIYFDYNKADIRPDAARELNRIVQLMNQSPSLALVLRSHTDSRGSAAFNQYLSHRRAESVRSYLVAQGITPSRLTAHGMGERSLVNRCTDGVVCDETAHQANRRTEFIIAGSEGRPQFVEATH